ncbi:MFS transporter [Lactiplantibacillus plajomi]|uniref:MFS transporter n=1 Tax=Lactiplantibacillus plajomi TaxID=1457217 RepID=A0ABV6K3R0_9LACO|nr:MFS transporter [Lactiplantibacillus plajomi]
MLSIIRLRAFQAIATGNLFATIGISLFNIVLLMYAKSFPNPHWYVSMVTVATLLPYLFSGITGKLADRSASRPHRLIYTKFFQAGSYVLLAGVINQQTALVFYLVILINVVSDIVGGYGEGLIKLMIQRQIPATLRQQAIGLNTSVATLIAPVGQTMGVVVMSQFHNYAVAGLINAAAFVLSALCLLWDDQPLAPAPMVEKTTHQPIWPALTKAVRRAFGLSAVNFLGIIMIANICDTSLDGILNLFFIDLSSELPVSYGTAIVLTNCVYVAGSVLGAASRHTWLDRVTNLSLLLITTAATGLAYMVLLIAPRFTLILLSVLVVAFCNGKLNPRLISQLMQVIPAQNTAAVLGTVSAVVMMAAPIGSMFILLCYNLYGATIALTIVLTLAVMTFGWCLVAKRAES